MFSRLPAEPHPEAPQLRIHGLAGRLPMLLAREAAAAIEAFRATDVLLQFTAQMWDVWRFGSPAVLWLARRARRAGARVTLMAHELYIPVRSRPDLLLAAGLQRLQFGALLGACDRTFVTTTTRADAIRAACRVLGAPAPGIVRVGASALPAARSRPELSAGAPPRLGVFSTAAAGKRFDVVLEAFERIARELPAAELVIIGALGAPEHPLVRKITDDIARHPARERIRITGALALPDVAREIAELDVYLFPMDTGANTRSSTLPTALGSGLATVAIRGEDTDAELFRDQENLVFAPALTGAAFASSALDLLRDPARRARIGEGARRLYEDHLSWGPIAERFLAALAAG
jgi:glycosyltransferase involved in cell wall biosynthesis